ncbi:phage tail protein [Leuconostoc carnosum]|uniref:Phage tail protein n=1 Tax=Leuconostoc carnosum TaxID=1252 RepID=A0AAE6M3C8_LEUCA|nr:phage head closure protein [Leuconostoc carnosum]QEA33589.1 phage tail protein [Leuconostoc carnosum]
MLKYKPSDFNKRIAFGTLDTGDYDDNGNPITTFVVQSTLHYAPRTRTMTQQYTILGTKLEDTILIVLRHSKRLDDSLIAKLPDGKYYDIVGISPDDSNNIITYDIVTLKLNTSIQ